MDLCEVKSTAPDTVPLGRGKEGNMYTPYCNKEAMMATEVHKAEPKWQTVPMFALTSAKRMTAVKVEARRQAIGVIANVAKLTLNEGPPGPGPDDAVGFDRRCDRK